jgi:hypothetical protein
MPDWLGLARRLAGAAQCRASYVDQALELELPLPAILSMIRTRAIELGENWPELVRKELYRDVHFGSAAAGSFDTNRFDGTKQPDAGIAKHIADHNPTLASIVELCATQDGERWRPRPHIGALLTYNFDSLVQVYDRARHGSPRILRTVERSTKGVWAGKIPLYHLHGLLHSCRSPMADEAADQIVLCEDEYHQRTDDPHHFASTTMQWALREFVTVFVGCSMTDELMRRSLFRAKREMESASHAEDSGLPRRHFAVLRRPSDDGERLAREHDMKELGVIPLWLGHWNELPQRFRAIGDHLDLLCAAADRASLQFEGAGSHRNSEPRS